MTEQPLSLEVKDVLGWYDGPELFTAIDQSSQEYLVYFCATNGATYEDLEESYLAAKFKDLSSVEDDLREFYLKSEEKFLIRMSKYSKEWLAYKIEKMNEDWLPPSWNWRE
jgi:hypothetical protein